ncbi:ubiquinol-cytochrome c reductase iron-sulfur subunit [Candidatus Endowatersipora endosymbiont of Watersipora subatra]|uniref:ubiquinol-cytochrome c reductase iron-sulfur subunit n=1 Tax=Candidatus Endowatersipora endosymbiont of Watersipora subatra TaxID=3077946 RepID=UPI00312CA9C2
MNKRDGRVLTRRDFLYTATGVAAASAASGAIWPLIRQLAPNDREKAAGEPVEVDISAISPGQLVTVIWRGKPYFIRHLTDEEQAAAQSADEDESVFRDFESSNQRIILTNDKNKRNAWAVVSANCTHLGCVPKKVNAGFEGWVCPCHGSKFDVTGRVIKGPAPTNLPLPPHTFATKDLLVIGVDKTEA